MSEEAQQIAEYSYMSLQGRTKLLIDKKKRTEAEELNLTLCLIGLAMVQHLGS